MRAARTPVILSLAVCGLLLASTSLGQQPTSTIVPVTAMLDASAHVPNHGASASGAWMPSCVAGHLADRLEALHEPLASSGASSEGSPARSNSAYEFRTESAARTLPVKAANRGSQPTANAPLAAVAAAVPKPTTRAEAAVSIAAPTAASRPQQAPLVRQPRSFGEVNPLRSSP